MTSFPVYDMFSQRARDRAERVAIIDASGATGDPDVLTYQELERRAFAVAQQLGQLGLRPGERVASFAPRSAEFIIAMLGILGAGGAYVPIDPTLPHQRVQRMLESSGARIELRTSSAIARRDSQLPGVDGDRPVHEAHGRPDGTPEVSLDDLAYVIYTSGSSGEPKGVAMSHRGLSRLILWQIEDGPPALTTLQFTAPGFDVTFQEVLSTLCTGGRLVLVADAVRRDPARLLRAVHEHGIERIFLPFVALQGLVVEAQRRGSIPERLRHVITAGEQLVVNRAMAAFFAGLPGCILDNHYGPTETHLVTSHRLVGAPEDWPRLPPIGRPVAGVRTHILDAERHPVASHEVGELYVGGDCVARGYIGDAALTEARFVPDPFSSVPGARMYRTGDLVRLNQVGELEFLGRSDDQIKIRGFRVEPGEVEHALLDVPGVAQASVGVRHISEGVKVLVAYLVADTEIPAGSLIKTLGKRLPEYMVPSRFLFLEELPRTATGKVDVRTLASLPLDEERAPSGEQRELPIIAGLRRIFVRVLGHDDFAADDDFFEIGGSSLLATWVVSEVRRELGIEAELSMLLEDSTLAGLADLLRRAALCGERTSLLSEAITMRTGPVQNTIFLVHPLGGELLAYRELVQEFQIPLRVLGLRWNGAAEGHRADTLEAMAAQHMESILASQPAGPYRLFGWSFGGVLAYEIGQQLAQRGHAIEVMGLIDANPVLDPMTGIRTSAGQLLASLNRVLQELEERAGRDEDLDINQLLQRSGLEQLLGSSIPRGVRAEHLRGNLEVTRDSIRAAMHYQARPFAGPIRLFQADASAPALQRALADELARLAPHGLDIVHLPGDHYSCLTGPALARAVQDALATPSSRSRKG